MSTIWNDLVTRDRIATIRFVVLDWIEKHAARFREYRQSKKR